MLSLAAVESCRLRTEHCISHPLVGLIVWIQELYSFLWVYLHRLVKLPVPMEPLSMPLMLQRCPSFVYRVCAAFIQSPFTFMLLFEGIWNLSRPFLSYLDFSCRPFPVLLLVLAHFVLPHYTTLLSTSCWFMGDALMPSFQRISFHQHQIIYSGIGV